jgi:hypothetical protein
LQVFDPPYTLLGAMYYIFRVDAVAKATLNLNPKPLTTSDYFVPETHLVPTLLIMLAQCVVMSALLWFVEFGKQSLAGCKTAGANLIEGLPAAGSLEGVDGVGDGDIVDDEDVCEASVKAQADVANNALIRIVGLKKSYVAVDLRSYVRCCVRQLATAVACAVCCVLCAACCVLCAV